MIKRGLLSVIFLLCLGVASIALASEQDCGDVCAESLRYGLNPTLIQNYQLPNFRQLTVDHDLMNDRQYMSVSGTVNVHDAPNGNVAWTLDDGFNFITAQGSQDGWVQVAPSQWIQRDHLSPSNHILSSFTGVFLDGSYPEYTIGWLLVNTYPSTQPGGSPLESNGLLYRYTMVSIFDTVEIDGWRWYQIGVDKWVIQTSIAKVEHVEKPEGVTTELWMSIDLYEQVFMVFEGDRPLFATLTATGLPRWPTYEGIFNIYFRQQRRNMSWGVPGDDFYYLEEVPWTMFFDEGRAVHGAYWHDGFGYRRSHGCVNLSITDAHWLYFRVAEEMGSNGSADVEEGPQVYVWSSDAYR
jgi:hypothetical protein